LRIKASELDVAVMETIKKQAEIILNSSYISELRLTTDKGRQISECERQIQELVGQLQMNYERFLCREIDKKTHDRLKGECSLQTDRLKRQLSLLRQTEREKPESRKTEALAKRALDETSPQRDLVLALVNKIMVYPEKRIEIVWEFDDFTKNN
jgi:hypothetical protein